MQPVAIHADRALTPYEEIADAVLVVHGSKIQEIGRRGEIVLPRNVREIRAPGKTVIPGFVDLHIHGAGGCDVMQGKPAALDTMAATVARFGTTSFLATTVTASPIETTDSVEGIAHFILKQAAFPPRDLIAEILGIHFEGPFISNARRGVHPAKWIQQPSTEFLSKMLHDARGTGILLTLAPELPGAMDLIRMARETGLVVAIGHTDASYEVAQAAIAAGVTHAAHVFNAMRPFSHRGTGVIGAVMTSPAVSAELIADGVHVDDAAILMLVGLKTANRVILISDGTSATGMPDGEYQLGKFKVKVVRGVCRNAEGKLAGSTLTLDRALRHMVSLGVPLQSVVQMLTANPARQIGLGAKKGILAPGADADLVFLDSKLEVGGVMTRGAGLTLT